MKHPHLMYICDFKETTFIGGHGSYLVADGGQEYLDFFTDVGTASLGYGGPRHDAVLKKLAHGPVHAPNLFQYKSRNDAAANLCEATGMDRVFFSNSGAEAVEAALKLARKFQNSLTGKDGGIWSYKGGFHGRTTSLIWVGDGAPYHREGFGSRPPDLGNHFTEISQIPHNAQAVILAPVFGNNDVRVYPVTWLGELRAYCTQYGITLIFDEVQTGAGRAGGHITFAQKVGVIPDILTMAKGIAMGAPVGVTLACGPVADTFTPGSHWSTFGGNPLSCAFVNGMLDYLTASEVEEINSKGKFLMRILKIMPWANNVRGEGMLIAFDTHLDTKAFAAAALEQGVIIGAFRSGPGAVKLTPPLNITRSEIMSGLVAMDAAAQSLQ